MKLPKYRYSISARSNAVGWTQWKFHSTLYLTIVLFGLVLALVKQQSTLEPTIIIRTEPRLVSAQESTPLPTPSPTVKVSGRILDKDKERWTQVMAAIDKVAPLYYAEKVKHVIKAQAAHESGVHTKEGLSNFCLYRWNCLGINAVDSNPDSAWSFENAEQMVIAYFERVIRPNFPEAWKLKDEDPEMFLYRLKNTNSGMMYATDPEYITRVKSMPEWSAQ